MVTTAREIKVAKACGLQLAGQNSDKTPQWSGEKFQQQCARELLNALRIGDLYKDVLRTFMV